MSILPISINVLCSDIQVLCDLEIELLSEIGNITSEEHQYCHETIGEEIKQ